MTAKAQRMAARRQRARRWTLAAALLGLAAIQGIQASRGACARTLCGTGARTLRGTGARNLSGTGARPLRGAGAAAFGGELIPVAYAAPGQRERASGAPTFYRDVLPILQKRCQSCHRAGEIAPMPFETYAQTRPWAVVIREAVVEKKMPPWFADSRFGKFSNDSSLTADEIKIISDWADAHAPAGNPRDAPPAPHWTTGWNISKPDAVIPMPRPVALPARGDVDYTYEIVPTHFSEDKWVRMSEIRPLRRDHVHHAVVYVRPPDSKWLRNAPVGVPFTAMSLPNPQDRRDAEWTDSDILLVYAPGSSPDEWPEGMAKLVPRGSDLVFQMHYTTNGHAASDRTSIGLVFAKAPPAQRVLTLQLTNDHFRIPAHDPEYRVEVHGTLPNDATLLSFFPHLHLRGKEFEYNLIQPDGKITETLLRVNYDFYWQLSYRLAQPRFLKAGTELQAVAWFDNSAANPHNPNPNVDVTWGDQTYDEMMVGFFDLAVPANLDKQHFFIRGGAQGRGFNPAVEGGKR